MARLSRDFFDRDTLTVSRELLGKYLCRRLESGELLALRLTETEAYIGRCDKACHAYGGRRTARTEPLFLPPGHAYIYLIYGMYHCLNLVTEPDGEPAAVLLRAGEAVLGRDSIRRFRFGDAPWNAYRRKNFLNGPGKLCEGLSLTRAQNGMDLMGDTLFLCDDPADLGLPPPEKHREAIRTSPRIGIDYAEEAKDFPWRFELIRED